ncbi:MAG: hypothetical protein RIS47_784 [Bacteroidota bacterium]
MESKEKRPEGSKPKKPSVFGLLKTYKNKVLVLLFVALFSNAINLVIPKIISHGIDDFTAGKLVFENILLEFFVAALVIFIFSYLQSILQTLVAELVARNLRTEVSEKISQQSYTFVQKMNPAKLLTNLTSDIDSVKAFVSQAIVIIVSSIFMIFGTSAMLLSINWRLGLAVIVVVPIIGGTFTIVIRKVSGLFKRSREIIDKLNRIINESIMGAAVIRVLNSQQYESLKFVEINTEAKDLGMAILRLFTILIPIIMFVANLASITILALGGHFVVVGSMSLGDFAAFNTYLMLLIFPILMIGFMSNIIAQAMASYRRIHEVLTAPDPETPGTVTESLQGDIRIENINFFYEDKPVLKNLSFSIKPGSKTAIIGPTAAGKSVLLQLLTGLLSPNSGSIEFNGKAISEFDKNAFHTQVGIVFQDSVMFNLSLRENIAFSDIVTDESLAKAIATAELSDYIETLPNRLDTLVSERGTSLSGGQKQRIMLARALAINPRILLLDDFTARVDRSTEDKILSNLEANYPELTLISVTQKIETVTHFDQIILLMEGELIATGTHQELLATCPEYVQINNSQRSTQHYEL